MSHSNILFRQLLITWKNINIIVEKKTTTTTTTETQKQITRGRN